MKEVVKEVNRWSIEPCHECHGRGVSTYETYEDAYDRHLWFHTDEERDAFKEKLLHMRGIKWEDEAERTLAVKYSLPIRFLIPSEGGGFVLTTDEPQGVV